MSAKPRRNPLPEPGRGSAAPREPLPAQIASFVDLFVWLLLFKSFFLPLFIIPTGSMAETLSGAHGHFTCTNCGVVFPVGFHEPEAARQNHPLLTSLLFPSGSPPPRVQCPNCRWQHTVAPRDPGGARIAGKAGDRIVVHGWPYAIGGRMGPQRWDVVVFRPPHQPEQNFIKRLIGLPGETLELIDGDVFITTDAGTAIAHKTPEAQQALWFRFFDQNHPPRNRQHYDPRWHPLGDRGGWTGLTERVMRFDGSGEDAAMVRFVNSPAGARPSLRIDDSYGYNEPDPRVPVAMVTDVRLSADVTIERGDGFVELRVSKYQDAFFARLHADGRLTLEHGDVADTGERRPWGETRVAPPGRPLRLALGHADYRVLVEVNGRSVLRSPDSYTGDPERLRGRSGHGAEPVITVAAAGVSAALANVHIDRDVHYQNLMVPLPENVRLDASDPRSVVQRAGRVAILGNGVEGNPIRIGPDEYFVLGDNSPQSHDSRAWLDEQQLAPHMRTKLMRGEYHLGMVPADQMIGRAFLVYWPGFLPLTAEGLNLLPDTGRIRWIH